MAGWNNDHEGECIMKERTMDERLARLEQEHDQLLQFLTTAGGVLEKVNANTTFDELKALAADVGRRMKSITKIKQGR